MLPSGWTKLTHRQFALLLVVAAASNPNGGGLMDIQQDCPWADK
jgi:hypothetical protein